MVVHKYGVDVTFFSIQEFDGEGSTESYLVALRRLVGVVETRYSVKLVVGSLPGSWPGE